MFIRVLTSPEAETTYRDRTGRFAVGAVIVKEEYADAACTDLVGWTAMRREPDGHFPEGGDFRWQRVALTREVREDGSLPRCAGCHSTCGGFDFTCAEP